MKYNEISSRNYSKIYANWLREYTENEHGSKAYAITFVFDPHREYRYIESADKSSSSRPDRYAITAGQAVRLTPFEQKIELTNDIERFNFRLNKKLMGRHFVRNPELQPRGVGYFEKQAALMRHISRSARDMASATNRDFCHAHIVLCLNGVGQVAHFEAMLADGTLEAIWKDINPLGNLDIRECNDIRGWLRYGSKNSKTIFDGEQADILLPALKGKSLIQRSRY